MKRLILIVMIVCAATGWAQNQQTRKEVRKGNRAYKNETYDNAQAAYHQALSIDSTYYKAQYNLGNALYRQKQYGEAAQSFGKALMSPDLTKSQRSQVLHNKGNSHLQAGLQDRDNGMEQFQQAVDDYKEALKLNPKNEDTRYNLSYAQKLLAQAQQQQQQGGGNNKQQDQNKDNNQQQQQQNQDQQNKNKQNKDQQQQNQQQDQQQNQNQQQQKKQQGQQDKKKQDAERLLEAVKNNERKTMKEQQKAAVPVKSGRIEKDW